MEAKTTVHLSKQHSRVEYTNWDIFLKVRKAKPKLVLKVSIVLEGYFEFARCETVPRLSAPQQYNPFLEQPQEVENFLY